MKEESQDGTTQKVANLVKELLIIFGNFFKKINFRVSEHFLEFGITFLVMYF